MLQVIAVGLVGADRVDNIHTLRWVEVDYPGSPAASRPVDWLRPQMVQHVAAHPDTAFVMSPDRRTFSWLEVVAAQPPYVRTRADTTTRDNLLFLPRIL